MSSVHRKAPGYVGFHKKPCAFFIKKAPRLTLGGEIRVVKGKIPGFNGKFMAKTGNFGLFFPVFKKARVFYRVLALFVGTTTKKFNH
jgi:hypothetical protein